MALSPVIGLGTSTTPNVRVGFSLRVVSPEDAQTHYHYALDALMRTLLTCFGSAHAEGGPDKAITYIYTEPYDVPSDADLEQLEDVVITVNSMYPDLFANQL